jgi:hypothetical protein
MGQMGGEAVWCGKAAGDEMVGDEEVVTEPEDGTTEMVLVVAKDPKGKTAVVEAVTWQAARWEVAQASKERRLGEGKTRVTRWPR